MNVKSLKLWNYRNYDEKIFTFKKGINVIIGDNGVGKTNIVEPIDYLSRVKSFRGVEDQELIKWGKEFSYVEAEIQIGEMLKTIKIQFDKNARQIFVNRKPIQRLGTLAKSVNVVLFEPKDVMLFKDSPRERRTFLNISLTKGQDGYLEAIQRYNKVLEERNALLKQENPDKILLQTLTEMLVKTSAPIVEYRSKYVKDINDILYKIARTLAGTHVKVEVVYHPYIEWNEHFNENALDALKRALDSDLKHKATSIGVHREDFSVNLNDKDIATYGSQGENRLVALALKLTPYFLVKDIDKRPIVVLDDVMSELDENHQKRLITLLKKFEQVFITSTKLFVSGANHYEIKRN